MLKMNVSNMCKEVHRVRVLYVHVFVSVYNFLRWNKIIKYKKKKRWGYLTYLGSPTSM